MTDEVEERTARRVVIVDDHELLSESVAVALRAEGHDISVINPKDDLQILATLRAGSAIVLLDLDLGHAISPGEDLVKPIVELGHDVIAVTGLAEPKRIQAAIDHGAAGFVHKSRGVDALHEAVVNLQMGRPVTDASTLRELTSQLRFEEAERHRRLADFERLTPREQQVLAALMDGATVDLIAKQEVVSVPTVRTHVRGILHKLGVNSQIAAVAAAHRARWRPSDEV